MLQILWTGGVCPTQQAARDQLVAGSYWSGLFRPQTRCWRVIIAQLVCLVVAGLSTGITDPIITQYHNYTQITYCIPEIVTKFIFSESLKKEVKSINPYLMEGED